MKFPHCGAKLMSKIQNFSVNGAMLQMCNGSFQEFDSAFNFGTRYEKKCQIPAHLLFHYARDISFHDLYIPYNSDTKTNGANYKLYAVPINILNNNKDTNSDKKDLTTRFFFVDNLSGRPMGKDSDQPEIVRYLKKFHIQ